MTPSVVYSTPRKRYGPTPLMNRVPLRGYSPDGRQPAQDQPPSLDVRGPSGDSHMQSPRPVTSAVDGLPAADSGMHRDAGPPSRTPNRTSLLPTVPRPLPDKQEYVAVARKVHGRAHAGPAEPTWSRVPYERPPHARRCPDDSFDIIWARTHHLLPHLLLTYCATTHATHRAARGRAAPNRRAARAILSSMGVFPAHRPLNSCLVAKDIL